MAKHPPPNIDNPLNFDWTFVPASGNTEAHYTGVLEFGEATFTIGGETLTTRAYRQEGKAYSIPGPTLRMTPGTKYVVQFKNTLPYEPLSAEHNTFKDPNVTNLHTHGLHISGETPSDDVTRFFEGGTGGDFVYDIPADHMGGSYWYHAHHHGSTFLQVSNGAFGNIIIDDSLDGLPANVRDMDEKQLIIGFLDPAAAGTGGDTLVSGTLGPTWTVNGQVGGNIVMPPNTWQHWRVLVADRDAKTKTVVIGSGCEVALMARDGVWRLTGIPKELPDNSINLTGASRADLAVRCIAGSNLEIDNEIVATISLGGIEDTSVHPYAEDVFPTIPTFTTWKAKRPSYLRDLRLETPGNFETVSMGARSIGGGKFDADVPNLIVPATDLQEWTIKGATNHPFHLHVYHFQAQTDCGDFEAGEFYDTIAAGCDVRFDLDPATSTVYDGRTIMHCHILAHEDQGAMGWADVVGGDAPPTFPADAGYLAYYELGGAGDPPLAPSSLAASAVSSSQIDLSWVDNASDETNFEVERSLDGVNFALVPPPLDANTTSYSDSGLAASTTYSYRVRATNANGASAYSNTASATTQSGGGATTMVVESVTVSTVSAGKRLVYGRAVVVVIDDQGSPVANAFVSGEFSVDITESVTDAETDVNGTASIDTTQSARRIKNLTFCVTSITHATLADISAAPGKFCGLL